ncbi:hypothetical protein TGAM01_v205302 [Trichoderma gamsii]|uniref:Uncharacterized protein n=1 Tax=Trichoderma gamsii TaxID=398673 RepID=A0A2P4ZNJ4_9HYPO|nr:hypothetical protein TGAM01_v205302 [Trichoderma gamsii]PON25865.1 hypothetical protein TGAM01_v205302 [Trichoderma gamsii]
MNSNRPVLHSIAMLRQMLMSPSTLDSIRHKEKEKRVHPKRGVMDRSDCATLQRTGMYLTADSSGAAGFAAHKAGGGKLAAVGAAAVGAIGANLIEHAFKKRKEEKEMQNLAYGGNNDGHHHHHHHQKY